MDPALWTVSEQVAALRAGTLTPAALVDASLARIERLDGGIGCMTQVFADAARRRARTLGEEGPHGPLWGIPYVAKEILATRSGRTTCGSRLLENYASPYDATVIERLDAAGAILLGKTNMDEFAMGSSTENSAFGPTRNPWDPARVPGGSSGGSAAAVAADFASFALGSDTGGSIRQPAAFCGVVGLKPTYGRVSRYGLVAFASSLDQVGPLTKSVADAALVLGVISGHDARDSTSLPLPAATPDAPLPGVGRDPRSPTHPDPSASSAAAVLTGLRVGIPRDAVATGVDAAVRADFDNVLQRLRAAGVTLVDVELPHAPYAVAAYYVVATADASSNLARFDGVRYTRRAAAATDVAEVFAASRHIGFGDEVKRRILLGTFVLSSGYYDAYYLRAQKVRTLLRRDFDAAFARCDVIAMPTSPTPPFALGERVEDPLQMYLSDVFTVPANLAGLPLGVQLMAPALEETRLLRAAAGLEAVVGFERLGQRGAKGRA